MGEALRGERWVGPALPALIGRAEDFEVDPKSSMKRLRSFKQKQTVIGFPRSVSCIEEEQGWIGNQAGG